MKTDKNQNVDGSVGSFSGVPPSTPEGNSRVAAKQSALTSSTIFDVVVNQIEQDCTFESYQYVESTRQITSGE